ncbi:MAG: phosphodiesterase [Altererythrobacter sp.]|nr:phosphodiesterase [Altererythrobacter sp.]
MANKEQSLLIAQMTDIHIGFDRESGDEEANLKRFRQALAHLLRQPELPDMLVLSGDLTDRGDAESFARLVEPLLDLPFPVYPLVGNHDTRETLLETFPNCSSDNGFVHYAIEQAGLRNLYLDTFEPGRHGGAFCEARKNWLSTQLADHSDTPTLIFMHHPPIVSGIDWMDPSPDESWIANFAQAIDGNDQILAIHSGHLHRSLQTSFRGVPLGVTGSIAPAVTLDLRQIDGATPDGRALIADEPPIIAFHRWNGITLVSHQLPVGDWPVLAHYGPELQPQIRGIYSQRE